MTLFNPFRRAPKPTPPSEPAPLPAPLLAPIPLKPVPVFQSLPITGTNPAEREVASRWQAFQRTRPNATWAAFVAELNAEHTRLITACTDLERQLKDYTYAQPGREYVP